MSLIQCPECGSKISDKATACPHCGFQSNDPTRPISEQDKYEVVPRFEYDIEEWNPNRDKLSVISYEDNKSLFEFFGNWKRIQAKLPALAEVIQSMADKEHIMAAKMDGYVKKLIDEGTYRFVYDKNGEILPTIRGAQGFVKQVRLEEMDLAPNISDSLNHLSTHVVMASILDKIEGVEDAIKDIHVELQNDRIALAESARDKLKQAYLITDTRLRETALLEVVNSSTEAKRILMRNFAQNMKVITDESNKSDIEVLFKNNNKLINSKVQDAFQDLVFITNAVQTECEGYAGLGEYEPCKECLLEFKAFIEDNKLDQRDTLLLLNENASQKRIDIVDEFGDIADRINNFDLSSNKIESNIKGLLNVKEEAESDE